MNVLVLGGNGFIGSAIVKELLNVGDFNLFCATRKVVLDTKPLNRLQWIQLDILSNQARLKKTIEDVDIIINAVGELDKKSMMEKVNFDLVKNLVDIISGSTDPSRKRLIQISSVGCYGAISQFKNKNKLVSEDTSEVPIGLYEETKTRADNYIKENLNGSAARGSYTILRPTNVFGPNMKSKAVLSLAHMVNKRRFFYIKDKLAVSTFVHVKDVAQSVRLVISNLSLSLNQTYIVSDDCPQTKFIETIADSLGVKQPGLVVPLGILRVGIFVGQTLTASFPLNESKVSSLTSKVSFDNSKLKQLGFDPKFSIYNKSVMDDLLKGWALK